MELLRTFDILDHILSICPEKDDMLACKEKGTWIKYSAREYLEQVENTSYGLMALGLKKGDLVVTISNNRPEWNIVDMALSQAGIIHVPVYPTISEDDYTYILNNCEPKLLIVSDKSLHDKLKPISEKLKASSEYLVTMNCPALKTGRKLLTWELKTLKNSVTR